MNAIAKKDEKAFSLFYERYGRIVLSFVLSKVHNKAVAEEIVQDFWLAFWMNPHILRSNHNGSVKVFLLQYFRFRIYDRYCIAVAETIPVEDVQIVSCTTADGEIEKEELLQIVHDALKNSSLSDKNVFWMRMERISAREAAGKLNVTTQTIHNKFSRSKGMIREYLQKQYPEFVKKGKGVYTWKKLLSAIL